MHTNQTQPPPTWKLSPSDLTFLWDECPRCFYLKVVHGLPRPRMPMPRIFFQIDALLTAYCQDKPTAHLVPALPAGVVRHAQRWVTSQPIALPGRQNRCFVRGRFDTVVAFDDGAYAVIDLKTSAPSSHHVPFYSRQLHAYAYALEHPAPGKLALAPISHLGLLVFEPADIALTADGRLAYQGDITWLDCPKDYGEFLAFLDGVLAVLEQPAPPPAAERCTWCQYRDSARTTGW